MDDKINQKIVMDDELVQNDVMDAKIDPKVVMDLSIFKMDGTVCTPAIKKCWKNLLMRTNLGC